MQTAFDFAPNFPPGFSYYPDFISLDEEKELIASISAIQLHTFIFQGYAAKRKVASFGYDYSFQNRRLTKGAPIPPAFEPIMRKAATQLNIPTSAFAELLVTEYPPGSVINWHRDAPPFDIIAGVSLQSPCIFKLRPHEKERQSRKTTISLTVAPCSLYVIRDESRTEWQHATAPVTNTRYSITLRTLKDERD